MKNKPVFYDSDCLSSFLSVTECDLLYSFFSKIIVPEPVYKEIIFHSTPELIKKNFKKLLENGFIEIKKMEFASKERVAYECIRKGYWDPNGECIGKGESSAIAFAYENGGVIASNNFKDIKNYVERYNLNWITTSFIIATAVEKNIISKDRANIIWKKMLKQKIMMPSPSFFEYYKNIFPKDCKIMKF